MNLTSAPQAWQDYLHRQKADPKIVSRIHERIKDILCSRSLTIGKPEPLKHALQGYGSRRISGEHRIVYRVVSDAILIAQLRYRY